MREDRDLPVCRTMLTRLKCGPRISVSTSLEAAVVVPLSPVSVDSAKINTHIYLDIYRREVSLKLQHYYHSSTLRLLNPHLLGTVTKPTTLLWSLQGGKQGLSKKIEEIRITDLGTNLKCK